MFPALAIVIGWNIARMQKENYGIRWSWIFGSGINVFIAYSRMGYWRAAIA